MRETREPLCPFCGAYTPRSCDLREEMNGECAWIEMGNWDAGDPDDDDSLDEECGRTGDGDCMLAGTEHCDFECPYRRTLD